MTLNAAEWFALGYGLGILTTWVWLLIGAVFPDLRQRRHRRRHPDGD